MGDLDMEHGHDANEQSTYRRDDFGIAPEPEREPPVGRNIAILIQCACGNRLELNPDISHGATDEWAMMTKAETWICKQCGRHIDVNLSDGERRVIDLRGFGQAPCTPA